jgi:uncharacterized repeat protein (TIGR03803 family)
VGSLRLDLSEQPDGFYATRVAALGLVRYPLTLGGCPAIVHTFSGPDGYYPYGGMIKASDGFFYGTTQAGGASGKGTIFRLAADGTHTVIHHFSGANGDRPLGTLVQASDGHLYGTTIFGGAFGPRLRTLLMRSPELLRGPQRRRPSPQPLVWCSQGHQTGLCRGEVARGRQRLGLVI